MKSKMAISQLKNVWGRVGLDEVPGPGDTKNTLKLPEPPRKREKSDRIAQLNLRIRPQEKKRIAIIALRENVTINEIFSRMLALYQREHGEAELPLIKTAPSK